MLGLGDNVQDSAPQANFQFEYSDPTAGGDKVVTITHTGGEDIKASNVEVQEAGSTLSAAAGEDWPATIQTGSSFKSTEDAAPDATIRVVWTSSSGSTSNTIGQSTVPS